MPTRSSPSVLMREVAELLAAGLPSEELWESVRPVLARAFSPTSVTVGTGDANATESVKRANGSYFVSAPMQFKGKIVGALCLERPAPFDPESLMLVEICALLLAPSVAAEQRSEELEQLAFTDALTGIANRRRFDEALAVEWLRCARDGKAMCVLMVDVDYFKGFNDAYGHPAGDRCLQDVASAMRACVNRPTDLLARYGGEEFVVLLPATELEGGILLAERLRESVAAANIPHAGSSLERVSISIGVASTVPAAAAFAGELVHQADGALYRAKLSGRNRVVAEGYESRADAAKRNVALSPYQLPERKTAIVGREAEVRALEFLVRENRLVTIVAFGGMGKTRLAIEVAANIAESFSDGVKFIELGSVTDSGDVASRIAAAFGLQVSAETPPGVLANALAGKNALLLLDNCEHLVEAVAPLVELLARDCPAVHILATSREAFDVASETVYRLGALALPQAAPRLSAEQAAAFGAVALFVARARAVRADFVLRDADVPDVIRICTQLEGIALAIELAVPRLRVLSVSQLAQKLSEHLRVLNLGEHSGPARQQTIRALVAWSYDGLSPQAQVFFRRLAVFAGGCTVEAAAAVCAGEPVDEWDVFDLLFVLVEKSLLAVTSGADTRYRMLEPIRDFALEKREEAGEVAAVMGRFVRYFADLAEHADAAFWSAEARAENRNLVLDFDNFRLALQWALRDGHDVTTGAALAGSLSRFWFFGRDEGRRWAELALERLDRAAHPAIEARLDLGLAQVETLPAPAMRAGAERALHYYSNNGEDLKSVDARYHLAMTLMLYYPDERATAERLATEGLAIARTIGSQRLTSMALRAKAQTMNHEDFDGRRAILREALELSKAYEGNSGIIVTLLMSVSELEFEAGNFAAALKAGREAAQAAELTGGTRFIVMTKANLAHYAYMNQEWETGMEQASDAVRRAESSQDQYSITTALHALASIQAATGSDVRAARLMGFCDARFGALHAPRQDGGCEETIYVSVLERLRATLGPALEEHLAAGGALTQEDAIREGLS